MNLPEQKKLTWEQHMRAKKKQEEQEKERQKISGGRTPGRCTCGSSAFHLSVKAGELKRTCKNETCQNVTIF